MRSLNTRQFLYIFLCISLSSCFSIWRKEEPLTEYRPILMARESLERSIVLRSPAKIESPAKIYYKDKYIFISERFKGVHIIDNTDPKNPINRGYVSVPGCVDMALKENTLYVDNATDLVAIDLISLTSSTVRITKRIREVFSEAAPPDSRALPNIYNKENRPKNSIIIGWTKEKGSL